MTFTAPNVIGTTIIRATSVQDTSKSSTVSIDVTGTIADVSINPSNPEVNAGTGQLLTVNVTGTGTFSSAVTWAVESGGGSLSSTSGTNVTFTAPSTSGTTVIRALSVQDPSKSMTSSIDILIAVNGTVLQWNGKALNGTVITVVDAKGKSRNTTSAPDGAFSIFLSPPYQITAVPSLGTNLVPMSYDNTTITNPVIVLRKNTFTLDTSPGFDNDCTPIASDGMLHVELSQPVSVGNTGEVVYIAPGIDYRPTFSYAHLTQGAGATLYDIPVKFDKETCYDSLIGTVVYIERSPSGTIFAKAALASVPIFPNTITKLNSDVDAFAPKLNLLTSNAFTIDGTTTLPGGVSSATVTAYLRVEYNIPLGRISKIAPNINLGLRTAYYPFNIKTINNSGTSTSWQIPYEFFGMASGLQYRVSVLGTVFERGTIAWSDVLPAIGNLTVDLNPPSFGQVLNPAGALTLPVNSGFRAPNGNIIPEIIGQVVQNAGCSGGNNFLNNYIFGLLGTSALWLGSSNDQKIMLPDTNEPARIIENVDYTNIALNALCIREANTTNVSDKVLDGRSIQRNFYTDAALTNPDFVGAGSYNLTRIPFRFIN